MEKILREFDEEVEKRCSLIRIHTAGLINNALIELDVALMGVPENVREMPLKELIGKYEGSIEKAACQTKIPERKQKTPKRNNGK
mgnify:CR=1 FL=1